MDDLGGFYHPTPIFGSTPVYNLSKPPESCQSHGNHFMVITYPVPESNFRHLSLVMVYGLYIITYKISLGNKCRIHISGQIITTSADVTLNGGLVRELPQNPLNSGLGIILICPDIWHIYLHECLIFMVFMYRYIYIYQSHGSVMGYLSLLGDVNP